MDLQCDITPPSTNDEVALVLWYKDESTTPLYSLDSRRRGLYQAKHAPGQEIEGRAYLDMSTHPTVLKLERLKAEDEGEYRCRVDFKIARSRNSLVILEIISKFRNYLYLLFLLGTPLFHNRALLLPIISFTMVKGLE